jgi:hypothetical protein
MKRVHYIAGAVGLAPMALAAATPGVAHAAAAPSAGHTKSVALYHIRGNAPGAATLDAFAAASSSPASPNANPSPNGCIGHNYDRVAGHSHSLKTWWTDYGYKVCFGTVEEHTSAFGPSRGHDVRVRVWSVSIKGNQRIGFSSVYPATIKNNGINFTLGLHTEFGSRGWSRAYMCTAWVSNGKAHSSQLTPICTAPH